MSTLEAGPKMLVIKGDEVPNKINNAETHKNTMATEIANSLDKTFLVVWMDWIWESLKIKSPKESKAKKIINHIKYALIPKSVKEWTENSPKSPLRTRKVP